MNKIFTFLSLLLTTTAFSQTTADFENFTIEQDTFLNGADGSQGFQSGNIFIPNFYNDAWMSWTGWSISNTTDVTTPGYLNQYSAITGSGYDGSTNYAVSYNFAGVQNILHLENMAQGEIAQGFHITNSTYAYLSMQEGDGFAKKFGGVTGDDPDFFLLTIKKYLNGQLSTDSIDFYLADYRFSDNTMDYLIDEWTYIDLTSLGAADSLSFALTSSDTGANGMNTPGYFCIDNFITTDGTTSLSTVSSSSFEVFPNPTNDYFIIKSEGMTNAEAFLYDLQGRLILSERLNTSNQRIEIESLPIGSYFLKVQNGEKINTKIIVKQ